MKINKVILIFAFFFITMLLTLLLPGTAYATSPLPPPEKLSGIVIMQPEVKITNEILGITVSNSLDAQVTSRYTLKNTSPQNVTAQMFFLASAGYDTDSTFTLSTNGTPLSYNEKLFSLTDENFTLSGWQQQLDKVTKKSAPLGDGTGFTKYTISRSDSQYVTAAFTPASCFFYSPAAIQNAGGGKVDFQANHNSLVVVSRQDITFETTADVKQTAIDNIYDFLENGAVTGGQLYMEEQFNLYLSGIDENCLSGYPLFSAAYLYQYTTAVSFEIDIPAGGSVELAISCYCTMEYKSNKLAFFTYSFTPQQYRGPDASVEINIVLEKSSNSIKDSSLDFSKTGIRRFSFSAVNFSQETLDITFGGNFDAFAILLWIIFGIIVVAILLKIGLIAGVVVVVVKICNRKKAHRE